MTETHTRPQGGLTTTVDRLVAEQTRRPREDWEIESEELGRVWAIHDATVAQLSRLPTLDEPLFNGLNDSQMHTLWYSEVFATDDALEADSFWDGWREELKARGYPVEQVSVYDFTSGACDVHDRLLTEKPDLFR